MNQTLYDAMASCGSGAYSKPRRGNGRTQIQLLLFTDQLKGCHIR